MVSTGLPVSVWVPRSLGTQNVFLGLRVNAITAAEPELRGTPGAAPAPPGQRPQGDRRCVRTQSAVRTTCRSSGFRVSITRSFSRVCFIHGNCGNIVIIDTHAR